MLSCKEVTEVCSAELERSLKLGEQLALRTHLMMCSGCTNYRKQMKTLRQVTQAYAEGKAIADDPPDGQAMP
jgi:predicted anti-sigma-YlaC factor YlaD